MSSRLADRLEAARRRRFVGRNEEVALFRSALAADELPFSILHVFGPGGVGKTSLLNEFIRLCDQAQVPIIYLDARNVEPAPETFEMALRAAMNLPDDASSLDVLATTSRRHVLLIDTYETLAPLDGWLRDIFFPQLSEEVLIVLAGREPPSSGWSTDPGWQVLLRTIPLRNLNPDESRDYLTQRGVPTAEHAAILQFTHGYPLALTLIADVFEQRPSLRFQPEEMPDVIHTLLTHFAYRVPSPAHRTALEACALVRVTTETLLAEMLALSDGHELFAWLRGISFIESRRDGLFPHDLVRETLTADLRWRNPDWYAELHRRARNYYLKRLQQFSGQEQQRILLDYIFLHRENPMVRPFFEWQTSGDVFPGPLREKDVPALVAMVARHEGNESAQLAAYWFRRQPQNVLVFRDQQSQPAGFLGMVALQWTTAADCRMDPAASLAWEYLEKRAPLRSDEVATLFRFWMAQDTYQSVSPIQSLIFVHMVRHYLTTAGLAFTFLPCVDPDFWSPVFAYADLARLPEVDYEIGGRRYGVYGHDWRAVPPLAWLTMLADREIASTPEDIPPPVTRSLVVLSKGEFIEAVRAALRDFDRPDLLCSNPLLQSRLVVEATDRSVDEARAVEVLRALLREAVEALQTSPRDRKLYRALYHTYLQPATTQEQAAELLDLPFSTYRRHLKSGLLRVVEHLWQKEIGAAEK